MRKGKLGIALFSAVILLAIVLLAIHTAPEDAAANPVVIQAGEERVEVWTEDGENYYAFLPGHVQTEQVLILPVQDAAALDGQPLPLQVQQADRAYELSWQENGAEHCGTLHLLSSAGVATLHLNTQSGSMDFIHAEKGNAERGSIRLYDETGTLNYSGDLKTVRGRGNSTWVVHEKKPYSLELTTEADLLGMGSAKKWILLADALDTSALRNKIVLDFAARAGLPYTPECRWTELYLNGEYAGLYLLCEKVEVDPRRVALGADGSLVCMDRDIRVEEDTAPYFVTDSGQYLQIHEGSDIGALKTLFQTMENALLSEEDSQWQNLIDLDSWTKKYLVEEVFGSYDAGFQSQYFFCSSVEAGSPVYAGPVWDFDSSLGNPSVWALNSPRGLFAWRPEAMAGYSTPWLHSLYQKEAFRSALEEEYESVFLPLLHTLLEETMDTYVKQIQLPFQRNRIRWDVETEGIQAEADAIVSYMTERLAFLSELWLEGKEFCIVRLQESGSGGYYAYYAVEPGTCFGDLPRKDSEDFIGWYREDTDAPFDPEQPVYEDLFLYPKYEGRVSAAEADDEESLRDVILAVYHYVPGAVLVLMGLAAVAVNHRKNRATQEKPREHSKIR